MSEMKSYGKIKGVIYVVDDSCFYIFAVSYTYKEIILCCELCYYRSKRIGGRDLEYDGRDGGRGRGRLRRKRVKRSIENQ